MGSVVSSMLEVVAMPVWCLSRAQRAVLLPTQPATPERTLQHLLSTQERYIEQTVVKRHITEPERHRRRTRL
jgi:hypothetical protein